MRKLGAEELLTHNLEAEASQQGVREAQHVIFGSRDARPRN
jgi:hypothetical protein